MTGFIKLLCRSVVSALVSIVVFVLVIAGVVWALTRGGVDVEEGSWVVVDFYGDVKEYDPPGSPMAKVLGGDPLTLTSILDGLDKAALDERVEGVILHLSSTHTAGWAKLQEIRGAVKRVQAAGKKVHGYADSMDARTYMLAAACDQLYMPHSGYMTFQGMGRTSQHVNRMLKKLGINPELHAAYNNLGYVFYKRGSYDQAIEMYNEAGQLAIAYKVFRCWVSEYQALPDLDANANAVAIQTIKLENEGWERDYVVSEPTEPTFDEPSPT